MSVTSCLAEFKFADPKDKTLFDAVKKEYREDGLNNTEAAKKAADEVIEAIKKDYLALESIVNEKGGVLPPLPEHLIRIEKNKEKTENNNKQQDTVEKLETEKKGKQYGGNKPNYRNKKTGELLYSDGEMSHLKQTTFIDRFNEAHEVVDEKMDGYELIGNPDNGHKPNYENDEPLANTDDVGGEMFGNRRQAGISLDEVKEADDTKKRVLAQKQNIWKRPDYQELVDNGVQPVIAHSIKQVYDKISTKPRYAKHDNKFIYEYVEGVETLRDAVNDLLTDSSAMNKIMLEVAGKAEARMGGKPFDILGQLDKSDVENYLLDKVFPKNKSGNRWGRSNQKGNDRANAMGRVYNKLTFNVNGFVDALKAIEDGWPAKKEAWQRKYKVLSRDNLFSIKKYKDEFRVVQGHRVSADATFETEQEAKAYINKQSEWFLVKQKFSDVVRGFDTQEEAIKGGRHLEEMVKKVQFKEPDTPVEKSVREGQDFREGKNVSTQDLKDVIGFGQVNFGNWMKGDSPKKNRERQAHTNSIYDAAHDLAEVLGVPIKAISLNGMLNIAVGAQGKGGSAAHFIPGINDINITKRTGAGSLAHEFAHGLDHYFAVQAGLAKRDEPFLSDWTHIKNDAEIRPEIVEHFKTISEAMNKIEKSYTQEEIEESRTAGFKRDQKYLESWLKNIAVENSTKRYTSLIKKIKDGDVGKLEQLGKAKQQYVGKNINLLREEYKKIKGRYFPLDTAQAIHLYSQSIGQSLSAEEYFENHPKSRSVATRYLRSAEAKESKSGKSYWSTSWEMFARAFEVYVADKLAEKNGKNEYLTSDWKTNPDALPDFVAEAQTRHPQGIEREKVNLAFDGLINELKTKETDQGTAIYSRKGHVRSSPLKPKSTVAQLIKRLRFKLRKLSIPFKPVIVQSISNLPKALLDNHNVPNDVRGVAYKGKSYLVADNIKVDEAHRVLQHEVIGHTAMEALLGNDFNQLIELIGRLKKRGDKQVVQVLEEIKSSYIDNAGQYNLDKTQEAREVIAHIAEKNKTHIIVRKIIGLIKKALAKIGYTSIDNADLYNTLTDAIGLTENTGKSYYTSQNGRLHSFSQKTARKGKAAKLYDRAAFMAGSSHPNNKMPVVINSMDEDDIINRIVSISGLKITSIKPMIIKGVRKKGWDVDLSNDSGYWQDAEDKVGVALKVLAIEEAQINDADVFSIMERFAHNKEPSINDLQAAIDSGLVRFESSEFENNANFSRAQSKKRVKGANTKWADQSGFENLDAETLAELGKIGKPPHPPLTEVFKEKITEHRYRWSNKLRQGIVDQYDSFKTILNDKRTWMLANLSGTSHTVVEHAVMSGVPFMDSSGAVDIDLKKKSLNEIFGPLGVELDRFMMWVAGNRAYRINQDSKMAQIKVDTLKDEAKALKAKALKAKEQALIHGNITGEDITEYNKLKAEAKNKLAEANQWQKKADVKERLFSEKGIDKLRDLNRNNNGKQWGEREATFNKVLKDFESIHNDIIKIGVATGVVSREDAALWKSQGFYVPFYRLAEDMDNKRGTMSATGLTGQQAYKKLKGASIQLDDLVSNTLLNWNHIIDAGLKNQAATAALKAAENMDLANEIKASEKGKNSIYIRENGQEKWYDIDQSQEGGLVLDSLTSLNYEGLNNLAMKVLRKFKRALTIGVTASPEFKVANLMRDTLQAVAVTDMSTNIAKNLAQGFKATSSHSETIERMEVGGGAFGNSGYVHGADPDAIRTLIKKGVDDLNILTTKSKIMKMFDAYQDFGARLENVNRASNFEQNIAKGMSLLEANFQARDHLDFARTGSFVTVRAIAQTVPFLNARLQGLDKLGRAAIDPTQRKQFLTVVGTYTLASLALYLMMKDDEDYKEAEDWERDTYHLFKIPGDPTNTMYRFPRPFEVGAIASITERALEQLVDDKAHGALFGERLLHALTETFAMNPTPQAIKPLAEVWGNKNTFTNRRIEGVAMKNLSPVNRKKAWSSQTAIGLSEAMDAILWDDVVLSPIQIDHLINGYLGWAGGFVTKTADMAIRPIMGLPERPGKRIEDYLLVGRFAREGKARNTKFMSAFYDNVSKAGELHADIRLYRENKDFEQANTVIEENKDILRYRKYINRERKKISNINKQIRLVMKNGLLSSDQKKTKLTNLYARRNQIAKRAVKRIDQ